MPEPDHRHLRPDQLLRLYAEHRDRGETDRMRAAWEALCVKTHDRVRGLVMAFTFPGTHEGFPAHRVDDAVQEAYLLVHGKAGKLRGTSEGEFYTALAQWVWNACMDYGRRELRHDSHIGGSFDEPGFEGEGDRSRFDDVLEAEASRRDVQRRDKEASEARLQRDHELVGWAISEVKNDGYRSVLELTYGEKLSGDEIAERLGITPDNVYQRRRRGLKSLEEILRASRP
jgi:RNA polymerase sigma factor (sigma-70 family)